MVRINFHRLRTMQMLTASVILLTNCIWKIYYNDSNFHEVTSKSQSRDVHSFEALWLDNIKLTFSCHLLKSFKSAIMLIHKLIMLIQRMESLECFLQSVEWFMKIRHLFMVPMPCQLNIREWMKMWLLCWRTCLESCSLHLLRIKLSFIINLKFYTNLVKLEFGNNVLDY